ncbi:hypothetical protein IAU60_001319 [Kwoniella sp. DSM 27419]
MDQNHAPPSPIRQRQLSARHATAATSASNATDNKLKNPVGIHRPPTCSSPAVSPTGLAPWSEPQEPSSATSSTSSMTWQNDEETAVAQWRVQAEGSRSSSDPTALWKDPSTQPIASSSRCPSPQHLTVDLTATGVHESFGPSSLLTSEPLNRTISANPSPAPQHMDALPPKRKRARAASLPTPTPLFKRRKAKHGTPTPSEEWKRSYESCRSGPSKIEKQKAAAAELGRALRSNKHLRLASPEQHCVVACRQPAINVTSLRTLDASEILKNPQLRHDLLFDSLAFRPVNYPSEVNAKSGYAEVVTGGRTPVVHPRASSFVADMYWDSIAEELATGCRCVRWKMPKDQSKIDVKYVDKLDRIPTCLCGRWRKDLNEADWCARAAVWPSRLPELIKTLREILISLMGSTTPCPSHFAHSFSKEALEAHEAICPTVTHALVPELYAALDPEFLTLQARRGVFDSSLFAKLGEAMKVHCAPVRDEMVDDMVRTALSGDIARGLRKCFDCAEVMKLDIANHQVHALRPFLWENASQFEYAAFQQTLAQQRVLLTESRTRKWIHEASRNVLANASPSIRTHLIGRCTCKNTMELGIRSVVSGFLKLVFPEQKTTVGSSWPPTVTRRIMGAIGIPISEKLSSTVLELPESLKMDWRRMKEYSSEVIDIAISHTILLAYQRFFVQTHGKSAAPDMASYMSQARAEITSILDKVALLTADNSNQADQRSALWRELSMRLAVQVIRPDHTAVPSQVENQAVADLAETLNGYILSNVSPESALLQGNLQRLQHLLGTILTDTLLSYRLNPASTFYDGTAGHCLQSLSANVTTSRVSEEERSGLKTGARDAREKHLSFLARSQGERQSLIRNYGLEGLEEPIKEVTDRMIKTAAFNLSVFGQLYCGPGMMVGAQA